MSGTKGMTHYSIETKQEAVRLHLEEGMSCEQVAQRLGMRMRKADRIYVWRQAYQREGEAGAPRWGCAWRKHQAYQREGEAAFLKPIGRPRKEEAEARTLKRLKMENALLKKFHTELCRLMLARRDIGSSNTTEERTR